MGLVVLAVKSEHITYQSACNAGWSMKPNTGAASVHATSDNCTAVFSC